MAYISTYLNSLITTGVYAAPAESTTTTLTASASSVALNTSVTFMATVNGVSPTGTVTFLANGSTLGTASVSGGVATYTASFATANTYSITAQYSGDKSNKASTSGAVSLLVTPNLASTVTTLQTSASSVGLNQPVTLTATVKGTSPTGTVKFLANGSTLATVNLAGGSATYQASFSTATTYSITAQYSGDQSNSASASVTVAVKVSAQSTTTALQASATSVFVDQPVTLTATVTGASPTGTVSFLANGSPIGSGTLSNGVATYQASFATANTYSITAQYSGDQNNATSTSAAVSIKAAGQATTTGLKASATAVLVDQAVTLTATVTGASPTGTITFLANGSTIGSGALSSGVATYQATFAAANTYSITARYSGDQVNAASTSAALSIKATGQSTTTGLKASATSVFVDQPVTLTATVTGASPTGTVTFLANGSTIGSGTLSSGAATYQATFATANTYSITAQYSGDQVNAPSASAAVSVAVAATFSSGVGTGSQTTSPGGTAAYQLTITPDGGYNGTLAFSCTGLPSEASCSFDPASLTFSSSASQTSKLTITTTAPTTALAMPPSSSRPLRAPLALAGLLGLLFGLSRMRRLGARLRLIATLSLLALVPALVTGCGGGGGGNSGGGGGGGGGNAGTPAGTYTVTVHADDSANNLHKTLTVTLVVQ